jgi:uncharacterized membrane protein YqhA
MKIFVIVILSLNVLRTCIKLSQSDEENGMANILVFGAHILALIFTCNL